MQEPLKHTPVDPVAAAFEQAFGSEADNVPTDWADDAERGATDHDGFETSRARKVSGEHSEQAATQSHDKASGGLDAEISTKRAPGTTQTAHSTSTRTGRLEWRKSAHGPETTPSSWRTSKTPSSSRSSDTLRSGGSSARRYQPATNVPGPWRTAPTSRDTEQLWRRTTTTTDRIPTTPVEVEDANHGVRDVNRSTDSDIATPTEIDQLHRSEPRPPLVEQRLGAAQSTATVNMVTPSKPAKALSWAEWVNADPRLQGTSQNPLGKGRHDFGGTISQAATVSRDRPRHRVFSGDEAFPASSSIPARGKQWPAWLTTKAQQEMVNNSDKILPVLSDTLRVLHDHRWYFVPSEYLSQQDLAGRPPLSSRTEAIDRLHELTNEVRSLTLLGPWQRTPRAEQSGSAAADLQRSALWLLEDLCYHLTGQDIRKNNKVNRARYWRSIADDATDSDLSAIRQSLRVVRVPYTIGKMAVLTRDIEAVRRTS